MAYGQIPWNKGLTKETDSRVAEGAKKTGAALKGNHYPNMSLGQLGLIRPSCSESRKAKIGIANRGSKNGNWKGGRVLNFRGKVLSRKKIYNILFMEQDGKCAICGKVEENCKLALDHDHETNEARGLLCRHCNMGLGFFRDNSGLLDKAMEYLKS